MRIVSGEARSDGKVEVGVEMDSLGDETVALLTPNFDPSILDNPVVNPFTAGCSKRLVTVTFDLAENAAYDETAVTTIPAGLAGNIAVRVPFPTCLFTIFFTRSLFLADDRKRCDLFGNKINGSFR